MCKHPNEVIRREEANATKVFALWKDGELDGLCLMHNGKLAIAYNVNDDDELDYFSKEKCTNVTNPYEFVRKLFGVDKELRPLYRVAAC